MAEHPNFLSTSGIQWDLQPANLSRNRKYKREYCLIKTHIFRSCYSLIARLYKNIRQPQSLQDGHLLSTVELYALILEENPTIISRLPNKHSLYENTSNIDHDFNEILWFYL